MSASRISWMSTASPSSRTEFHGLPANSFVLDRPGLARVMSLPPGHDSNLSPHLNSLQSYPRDCSQSEKRTAYHQGAVSHCRRRSAYPSGQMRSSEAGFREVPGNGTAARRKRFRVSPSRPIRTSRCTCSWLYCCDLVRPAVRTEPAKTMEIRFFAPVWSAISTLLRLFFGNGGDPYLPESDSAFDLPHGTRPHGLRDPGASPGRSEEERPRASHFDEASERQRRDGICWRKGMKFTTMAAHSSWSVVERMASSLRSSPTTTMVGPIPSLPFTAQESRSGTCSEMSVPASA